MSETLKFPRSPKAQFAQVRLDEDRLVPIFIWFKGPSCGEKQPMAEGRRADGEKRRRAGERKG